MKKILLLAIISIFAIILSACGPKVGKTNREEIKPSGDVERIEVTEEEITTIPVVDLSKLSVKHDVDYRMGTIEDPVKIGEFGRGTSLCIYSGDEYGSYGYDIYLKVTGRMTDEEVDEFMNNFRKNHPEKEIDDNFVFMGVNFEVDFNGHPDLAQAYSLGLDQRLENLPFISIESKKFSLLNGLIIKATIDDEHIEDNHFQIIFSQFKEKDEHPLLKVICFKGDSLDREEETYCYYEM
ncbi:MAG: hypothetical protein IKR04_05785 [Clostridia bacterium]|nr:hypothetical protein [Clostridia bacterium]